MIYRDIFFINNVNFVTGHLLNEIIIYFCKFNYIKTLVDLLYHRTNIILPNRWCITFLDYRNSSTITVCFFLFFFLILLKVRSKSVHNRRWLCGEEIWTTVGARRHVRCGNKDNRSRSVGKLCWTTHGLLLATP